MPKRILLHYGVTKRRDAPAIVFLHGFMGSGSEWDEIVAAFAADHCCVTIDLPGHGRSPALECPEADAFEECANKIIEVIEKTGVSRCPIVGYSMGGRIALFLACRFPDRFSRLVLESASPGLRSAAERCRRRRRDEELAHRLESVPLAAFIDDWYAQPLFASLRDKSELLAGLRKRRLAIDAGAVAQALRRLGAGCQPNLWDELRHLEMPVLFVAGAADAKYAAVAAEFSRLTNKASVVIVNSCGHNTHLENPTAFSTALRRFLESAR